MGLFDLFTGVNAGYQHIDSDELQKIVKEKGSKNVSIIDVRSSGEYKSGHIPNARNMNVMDPGFTKHIESLDKGKTHYIICASGGRSKTACGIMSKKGFENVFNVKRGMMGWSGPVQ
mgnify:CR=1 FL=1